MSERPRGNEEQQGQRCKKGRRVRTRLSAPQTGETRARAGALTPRCCRLSARPDADRYSPVPSTPREPEGERERKEGEEDSAPEEPREERAAAPHRKGALLERPPSRRPRKNEPFAAREKIAKKRQRSSVPPASPPRGATCAQEADKPPRGCQPGTAVTARPPTLTRFGAIVAIPRARGL